MKESLLFTPCTIGPLTLRNRTIRAAAFEGMAAGNAPTDLLYNYHRQVAAGGIGMTTLAYASVTRSGLSFPHQLSAAARDRSGTETHHRCHPCRRRRRQHTDRTLRKHVTQSHLRMYAAFGLNRIQSLFAYLRPRHAARRNRRRGQSFRTGR